MKHHIDLSKYASKQQTSEKPTPDGIDPQLVKMAASMVPPKYKKLIALALYLIVSGIVSNIYWLIVLVQKLIN